MSETNSENNSDTLSFEEGRKQTKKAASKTKTYIAELPEGGVWEFEYQMVANIDQIVIEKMEMDQRNQDVDFSGLGEAKYEIFCEGVVDAPDGFPLSPTKLKNQDGYIQEIIGEVADRIEDFSTADEETIHKFH